MLVPTAVAIMICPNRTRNRDATHGHQIGRGKMKANAEYELVDPVTAIRLSLPWIYTTRFYARAGAINEIIQEILANPFPPSVSGIYQQSRAITSYDASARLREINCPTLVVVGDEDILGGINLSAALARDIQGAQLVVLKQAAHGLLTECAEATAASMMDFLSNLGKRENH